MKDTFTFSISNLWKPRCSDYIPPPAIYNNPIFNSNSPTLPALPSSDRPNFSARLT